MLPVAVATLLGGGAYALHTWAPWSATTAVFGTADPETDLVARSLIESVEERAREQAEETANALPNRLRVPGQIGVRDWFFQHFPLHPILLVFFGAASVWLWRWIVAERERYLRGLRHRMRAYQRRDLERLTHRPRSRSSERPARTRP